MKSESVTPRLKKMFQKTHILSSIHNLLTNSSSESLQTGTVLIAQPNKLSNQDEDYSKSCKELSNHKLCWVFLWNKGYFEVNCWFSRLKAVFFSLKFTTLYLTARSEYKRRASVSFRGCFKHDWKDNSRRFKKNVCPRGFIQSSATKVLPPAAVPTTVQGRFLIVPCDVTVTDRTEMLTKIIHLQQIKSTFVWCIHASYALS